VEEAAQGAKSVAVRLNINTTEMSFLRQFDCAYSPSLAQLFLKPFFGVTLSFGL
jgi:hypothetical protein